MNFESPEKPKTPADKYEYDLLNGYPSKEDIEDEDFFNKAVEGIKGTINEIHEKIKIREDKLKEASKDGSTVDDMYLEIVELQHMNQQLRAYERQLATRLVIRKNNYEQ